MEERFIHLAERLADRLNSTQAIIHFVGDELGWSPTYETRKRNFYRRCGDASLAEQLAQAGLVRKKARGGLTGLRSDIRLFLGTRPAGEE